MFISAQNLQLLCKVLLNRFQIYECSKFHKFRSDIKDKLRVCWQEELCWNAGTIKGQQRSKWDYNYQDNLIWISIIYCIFICIVNKAANFVFKKFSENNKKKSLIRFSSLVYSVNLIVKSLPTISKSWHCFKVKE